MLDDMSMISEICDEPSVSDYPSYSVDESMEKNEDDTDALLNQIFAPNAQDHRLMADTDNTDQHDYRTTQKTQLTTTTHSKKAEDSQMTTADQIHETENNETKKKKKKKKQKQSTHGQKPPEPSHPSAEFSMHALLTQNTDKTPEPTPGTTTNEPVPNLNENNSS